ncbi:DUF6093 family protein [Streptomyces sp. NPDC127040]|uniref:DUF6093 family protein n=1 Tax=Streptomyces sp. NPDC127040 TaxID=3347116 RepID=UPI003656EF9C
MSDLDAGLAAGRLAALELQRETISLYRPGAGGFNWETGADIPAAAIGIYAGPARVKPDRTEGREVDAGEANVTLRRYVVSLPWGTPAPAVRPRPGDVIDVTASPDARMVGLRLWVTGVETSSTATAWRIAGEDRS